ncbi:preprotein translocase subunit YajC [Pirellula sp. SH-Sr6A]|uniref:preprotein translocase subunit YajC n=1 Tax=Pirellula sp. SH-Sr6A TaxID=1632865 RepID=UPI00078B402A|nr:preprotein translocase subunit YajC [Pirellula sp. SH-Sr6A]AMV32585.1 preprotein translocase subunit YajC [Pirellula sp. SH-Sr6A]
MGRFVPSIIAVSLVLGVVPVDELRALSLLAATQEGSSQPADTPSTAPGSPALQAPTISSAPAATSQGNGEAGAGEVESGAVAERELGSAATGNGKPTPGFMDGFFNNPLNLILLMFVALYVVLLLVPKPGKKAQKALQERLANLKKNDRVVLSSGIHGVIANINAEAGTVTVRVDESTNTRLTVDRASIRSVEA